TGGGCCCRRCAPSPPGNRAAAPSCTLSPGGRWHSRARVRHITIRASDRAASELFYDTVLRTIGMERSGRDEEYTVWNGEFSLAHADDDRPVTSRLHIGFTAPSREHVHEFWRVGTEAGYQDDGEPRPRPRYAPDHNA